MYTLCIYILVHVLHDFICLILCCLKKNIYYVQMMAESLVETNAHQWFISFFFIYCNFFILFTVNLLGCLFIFFFFSIEMRMISFYIQMVRVRLICLLMWFYCMNINEQIFIWSKSMGEIYRNFKPSFGLVFFCLVVCLFFFKLYVKFWRKRCVEVLSWLSTRCSVWRLLALEFLEDAI